jgi:hypothetical protein
MTSAIQPGRQRTRTRISRLLFNLSITFAGATALVAAIETVRADRAPRQNADGRIRSS